MKVLKDKKLIIPILIVTILVCIFSSIITIKQCKIYQDKIDIVVANLVGIINEKYPEVDEAKMIAILNMDKNSLNVGYNILEKYGIKLDEISAIEGIQDQKKEFLLINITSIILFLTLIIIILFVYSKKRNNKINEMTKYIEAINMKNYNLKIEENSEDELSNLTNELYKITVMLKEQAESSIKDKKILQTSLEDISHQLKTPLTSISIMLDNISENPDMDESTRQTFVHEINRQVEWINWLVISLLKLYKLDSGTATFTKKEIDAKALIDNVIKNLAIPLDIKQQHVIIEGKDAKLIGDYNWQLEAITNIVKNCIEHTPENKRIFINFEENNFYTKIVIRDEGVGIDKHDVKHIFERFYKGKNSSENSVGIGLALAKTIIEKDNGYITCSSEVDKGTTFEIKYMKT